MTEFKTVEGHPIVVGECYETRDGRKAFVTKIEQHERTTTASIAIVGIKATQITYLKTIRPLERKRDLMRPWVGSGEKNEFGMMTEETTAQERDRLFDECIKNLRDLNGKSANQFVDTNNMVQKDDDIVCIDRARGFRCSYCDDRESAAKKDDDGWIEWREGHYPESKHMRIEIKYRINHKLDGTRYCTFENWEQEKKCYNIYAYRVVDTRKRYKLSEMWRVWYGMYDLKLDSYVVDSKIMLRKPILDLHRLEGVDILAITRADATEFVEGEGVE